MRLKFVSTVWSVAYPGTYARHKWVDHYKFWEFHPYPTPYNDNNPAEWENQRREWLRERLEK